jgi:hypothetical protein
MSLKSLEKRIESLEFEVAKLKRRIQQPKDQQPWWKKVYGAFRGDPAFLEAMALGRKWRESGRPKRRKKVKQKNAGS